MKMSQMFVETLREFPQDAEIMSHKLLVKAGFIRRLTNGVYIYLPLMFRVLQKIENIVREEMDASGAQELLMPFVQPKELWEQSGRWDVYGKELMRLKDRHNRELCLGPTHEEIITFVAREGIRSYKQLPVNLYQIQSKFRDEIRPRFGLLRGREFIMKDAYSFATCQEDLEKEYEKMAKTYTRIFKRCGLDTKMVQSDSGAIGGAVSHEFMVLLDNDANVNAGENDVFYCENCNYQANSNHAVSKLPVSQTSGAFEKFEKVYTPNVKTIAQLEEFFKSPTSTMLKTIAYIIDKNMFLACIRGDRDIEETKLMNYFKGNEIRLASEAEIIEFMEKNNINSKSGFISPYNLEDKIQIIADNSVKTLKNFIMGANEIDYHYIGANLKEHLPNLEYADICLVKTDDVCIECGGKLKVTKGIEVGNIFQLGTKYSAAMNATYTDENGKNKPFIMGCYGIGISRTAASAVEVYNDEYGIKWPVSIAPYHVCIVPVNIKDEKQMKISSYLYQKLLENNIEVVLDDRDERAGVKFKDADLIGYPLRINVGKTVNDGLVELKYRQTGEVVKITPDKAIAEVINYVKSRI